MGQLASADAKRSLSEAALDGLQKKENRGKNFEAIYENTRGNVNPDKSGLVV